MNVMAFRLAWRLDDAHAGARGSRTVNAPSLGRGLGMDATVGLNLVPWVMLALGVVAVANAVRMPLTYGSCGPRRETSPPQLRH